MYLKNIRILSTVLLKQLLYISIHSVCCYYSTVNEMPCMQSLREMVLSLQCPQLLLTTSNGSLLHILKSMALWVCRLIQTCLEIVLKCKENHCHAHYNCICCNHFIITRSVIIIYFPSLVYDRTRLCVTFSRDV